MIRPAAGALLALLAAPASAAPTPRLDALIRRSGFEGVVVAGKADRPSIVRVTARAAPGVPKPAEATWRWASVTKQVTALIAMQEVAAGRLALDKPVTDYWPDWPQVFSDEITIRDLLQHTTGLADPNEDGPNAPDGMPLFYRPAAGKGTMAYEATHYCAEHPRTRPGATYHYNNCDFIVLGALLERLTGKPFTQLVQERIAGPLNLRIGLFAPDRPPALHVRGLDEHGRPEKIGNLGTYGAAGSLHGSPLALYAIDRALLAHHLLDPAATETMWTGDAKLGHAALGQWQYRIALQGCAEPVSVVERRGQIGGVQIRNYMMPETGEALVLFTRYGRFDFGEVWQRKGFGYQALSMVGCAG